MTGVLLGFVSNDSDKFMKLNRRVFVSWFEAWLINHVPRLIEQPKWFNDSFDIAEGDVVLFLKHEGSITGDYQYGMIDKVNRGNDEKVRSVNVRYRNAKEDIDTTAVRQLVMIHPIDNINLLCELHEIATVADMKQNMEIEGGH